MKIGVKLALSITILLFIALGSTGLLSYLSASDALHNNIVDSLEGRALGGANIVGLGIDSIKLEIEGVASKARIQSMDWQIQKPVLIEETERLNCIRIGVADKTGMVNFPDGNTLNIVEEDYYKKALQGATNMTDPMMSEIDKKMIVAFLTPIKDINGEVLGVLAAHYESNVVNAMFDYCEVGESGYGFAINKVGVKVVHPNNELVINKDNDFENVKTNPKLQLLVDLEKKMANGEQGFGVYFYDGIYKFMAFAPVKGMGWSVGIAVPKDELFKEIYLLKTRVIIVSAFFVLLGALICLIISRLLISKPIDNLVKISEKVAIGDIDVDVDIRSKDEIGLLMEAFKSIIDSIKGQAYVAEKLAAGDLNINVDVKSEKDILAKDIQMVIVTLKGLISEIGILTAAAVEGDLDIRGDTNKFKGEYRAIISGINNTLNAIIEPIKESSGVLQELAKGNLHVNVKGDYKGDHAQIKTALNDSINTILSYISEISGVLTEMAKGDLDVEITADYKGDFVEIKNSLNYIVQALNTILGDINSASEQVASGSRQVSDGSQALSQGSTEQASSIEELSASITEIAEQTKNNAINANHANELALNAKENAILGNEQMKEMLNSMVEINESSANISKIIKVIDEIAFQTNILALNAAVEAARAGQHGKGFAVVAEEVRNLAARSANAAKETTTLIEGSIRKVEAGTKTANETAVELNKIVSDSEKVAKLVGEIASASNEQASAIAQINRGIEQVSQVVQTNSATAEESAAISEELSSQSELLKDMVSQFKLKNGIDDQKRITASSFEDRKKNSSTAIKINRMQAAAVGSNPRIALSDKEFGKY